MSSTHAIPASVKLTPQQIIALRPDAPLSDDQLRLAERQLEQLARMADIVMERMEDLNDNPITAEGKPLDKLQVARTIERLTQAMRRIHALEQETIGLREKRVSKVKHDLLTVKKTAARQSVERSLATGKPDLPREKRERLLDDLFSDYRILSTGTVREVVAQICKDIGIAADLSLWEEPSTIDIVLPAGLEWILPVNGDKPYTRVRNGAGQMMRMSFDSPHVPNHLPKKTGPTKNGLDPPKRE
jgi:hypothetical protein